MNQLINYIKTYVALSDEECEVLMSLFEIRKLRNNEVFFEEGQIANELYFVTKGCIRLLENPVLIAPFCQSKLTLFSKIRLTPYAKIKMSPAGM